MQIQSDDEEVFSPGVKMSSNDLASKKKKVTKFEEEEKKTSGYKFWCDSCGSDEELHIAKQTVIKKTAKLGSKNRGLSPDKKGSSKHVM